MAVVLVNIEGASPGIDKFKCEGVRFTDDGALMLYRDRKLENLIAYFPSGYWSAYRVVDSDD